MNSIQLFRYRLPLIAALRCGNQQINSREGLLLRRRTGGHEAWGDAAPLPGFSHESLSQVIDAARQGAWDAYPSLQFAHASLDLAPVAGRLDLCALLVGEPSDSNRAIETVGELPHTTVKLKVARGGPLEGDIEAVRAIQRNLRPDQRLRLDANRGWSYEQAVRFAGAVDCDGIEFLEEPTSSPRDFERLYATTGIPYALDETLRDTYDWKRFPHVAALIIKPTLMGSLDTLNRWTARDVPLVFSAAFESGIGLWNIARLALRYAPRIPVGLDTYRWLAQDVLIPRLALEAGQLDLHSVWDVNSSYLEERCL